MDHFLHNDNGYNVNLYLRVVRGLLMRNKNVLGPCRDTTTTICLNLDHPVKQSIHNSGRVRF